jgi:fluoride exporter
MIVVAVGGAFGSVARLLLSRCIQFVVPYEGLPWGIITVNIVGCFLIGILYAVFQHHLLLSPLWRVGLIVGVLGGFTTFSSFSLDTFHFLLQGEFFSAISNVFISVAFCLLATALGVWCINFLMMRSA